MVNTHTGFLILISGETEGKGERMAETQGKRRARNGKGAPKSPEERGSCIFSIIACWVDQRSSGISFGPKFCG